MVKLYVKFNNLVIVLHKEFQVFTNKTEEKNWEFQRTVKCEEFSQSDDNIIECCNFSPCGNYFCINFNKNIIIYETMEWSAVHISPGERRASCINFFPKSNVLLFANKSGSALFYSFNQNSLEKLGTSLGHNSMLTSALITDDEKFVITSDRDEKIRVTNYPNVYNIESFCLGHTQFISWLGFLSSDKRVLISCSGDGTVRFWDYQNGRELLQYDCKSNGGCNASKTHVIIKIEQHLCKRTSRSILAVLEYKSTAVQILNVTGDLNKALSVDLIKTLQLPTVPWDIAFCDEYLFGLLPNKDQPVILWSAVNNIVEDNSSFQCIKDYISQNFNTILSASYKISDEIPVMFKREVDNIREYEQRKRARLLKTGKTS